MRSLLDYTFLPEGSGAERERRGLQKQNARQDRFLLEDS